MKRTHPAWRHATQKVLEDMLDRQLREEYYPMPLDARAPKGYHKQTACSNCKYVFRKSDYDEGYTYYCTFNAPKRPLCGSCAMNEHFWRDERGRHTGRLGDIRWMQWEKWRAGREVSPTGICPNYGKGE